MFLASLVPAIAVSLPLAAGVWIAGYALVHALMVYSLAGSFLFTAFSLVHAGLGVHQSGQFRNRTRNGVPADGAVCTDSVQCFCQAGAPSRSKP
ncbi:hypothetical protein [Roseibium sp. SCP14]|uniref:hypothetical protein n=1 Tax=Roseibium sp. SCP14 TaxID=3141375 RepID=UPI0033364E8E